MQNSVIRAALLELYVLASNAPYAPIPALSEEEHQKGVAALGRIIQIVGKWPEQSLCDEDEQAIWVFVVYGIDSDSLNWKDEHPYNHELNIFLTKQERVSAREKSKVLLVSALEELREHLDLRRIATEANKVALSIGRTDLRLRFEESSQKILYYEDATLDVSAPYALRVSGQRLTTEN